MILWRDAKDSPVDNRPSAIEIIKQEGVHVWYRILDNTDPNKGDVYDSVRNALDPDFYEITKAEYVKRVLKGL